MSTLKDGFIFTLLKKYTNTFMHLIYPNQCLVCLNELPESNRTNICHLCQDNFHFTYFETSDSTRLDKLFWGRLNVHSTFSLLEFEKQNSTQKILHAIKYKSNKLLAGEMGKKIGNTIHQKSNFATIEVLIPVPLHIKKKYIRGYNQSEVIAEGVNTILNVQLKPNLIRRTVHSESQTKKNKFSRWDNVKDVFQIDISALKKFNHIAIIDDVITTGSTIEAITLKIHKEIPDLKISIISLAIAK